MTIFDALILGSVQGLAEFLPISSSGHLVIFQHFLGLTEPTILFDTTLHFATLLAVVVFFWRDLWQLKKSEMLALVMGTIPAVVVGLLFKNFLESLFAFPILVSMTLILSGFINLFIDKDLDLEKPRKAKPTIKDALIIGIFQAVAITPGISRSGSTVLGGLKRGLDRVAAFKFSFMLSVPAILGAVTLQLVDVAREGITDFSWSMYVLGALSALITGLLALWLFRIMIQKAKFEWFFWYCLIFGSVTLLLQFFF